jgi:hypothetical protein
MNLDYWFEQVKATTAMAASLAGPVAVVPRQSAASPYMPMLLHGSLK